MFSSRQETKLGIIRACLGAHIVHVTVGVLLKPGHFFHIKLLKNFKGVLVNGIIKLVREIYRLHSALLNHCH